jgi:integrase/recombinase XerD
MSMHSLSKEQLGRLLEAARKESYRDWLLLHTGFCHGLRASELCGLTAADVRGGYVTISRLKGSEPATQQCSQALTDFAKGKTGRLFGIRRRQLHNIFVKYAAAADIPEHKRHAHVLRHTCAVLMLEGGAKINEVQKRLSHRNGGNTLKYLEVSNEAADQAFAAACGF